MNRTNPVAITAVLLLACSETAIAVVDDAFIKTVSTMQPEQEAQTVVQSSRNSTRSSTAASKPS